MSDPVQSLNTLNYSGMLFNSGNVRTPLLSMIGGRRGITNSHEFVMGQNYATEDGVIPNISETASLTAPEPTSVTRTQDTNVTQIFQETVYVSDAKLSNYGALAGANIAGQTGNPINELDFQIGAKMAKIGRSIEKTFINGTYNKATDDTKVNKTRGLVSAITTNTLAGGGDALSIYLVDQIVQKIYDKNGDIDDLCLWLKPAQIQQLINNAIELGVKVGDFREDYYGLRVRDLLLNDTIIHLVKGVEIPDGTALVLNVNAIRPMEQPVPGKGNFYYEALARTGAGEKGQIFGQIGLDYANELFHGKITGLATTASAPVGMKVQIASV